MARAQLTAIKHSGSCKDGLGDGLSRSSLRSIRTQPVDLPPPRLGLPIDHTPKCRLASLRVQLRAAYCMFRFLTEIKERRADQKYISEMQTAMSYLLAFANEEYIKRSLIDRPGIVATGRKWRQEGVSPQAKGAEVLSIILGQDILEMGNTRRSKIVEDLRSGDLSRIDRDEFASMISMFHTQIEFLVGLDPEERKLYLNDLFGALAGRTPEERRNRRIEGYVYDAFLDSGWMCEVHGGTSLILEPLEDGITFKLKCASCNGRLLREATMEQIETVRELHPEMVIRLT